MHTPEPWFFDPVKTDGPTLYAIVDEDGFTICEPSPMGKDNAQLIAAAPKLLAALGAALDEADAEYSDGYPFPSWYARAKLAYQAAKGFF